MSTAPVKPHEKALRSLRTRLFRRLAENRKRLVVPWSLYQIARQRGCNRSLLTLVLQGKKTSKPVQAHLEAVARGRDGTRTGTP